MEVASVQTLANYETEITFPPGPAGILLEPVVRCGNRAVGARIAAFPPSSNVDLLPFFVRNRASASPSKVSHLAADHLSVGAVLVAVDGVCTKNQSFDRIMAILHERSAATRALRFKDVEAAWLNSTTRGSPSLEVPTPFARC